jgi:hypothetical protein
MAQQSIIIDDLTGGMSDDHAAALKANQTTHAYDVDFWAANCAGRRNGTTNLVTGIATATIGMFHHTPTDLASGDLLFTITAGSVWKSYTVAGVPTTHTATPATTFDPARAVDAVSLHGKLFIACRNSVSRMHMYDGTNLRRAGFTVTTAAPTAVDTAVAGTYATTRYFRVRWVLQVSGSTVLRSEPSATLTKVPNGAFNGLIVTRPTAPGEGETHWEIEESIDNANFYRLSTVILATTTYTDTLAATSVATTGTLSEDIGDYTPLRSARWLTVDNDRLVLGGDVENVARDSDVQWTPLSSALGVGNDERIPSDQANYITCDGRNKGGLTGLKAYDGKLVAFKSDQIHVLVRAGNNGSAYLPGSVVRSMGALPFSVCEGFDSDGKAALYFLDPSSGPAVMGATGTRSIAPHLRRTWKDNINRNATVRVCHAVYYADKQQVWWYISTGANNTPNQKWVYHTETGGTVFHTVPAAVSSSVMWDNGAAMGGNKPTAGLATTIVTCDTTATSDSGTAFRAYTRTKAYTVSDLLHKGGVMRGVIEADTAAGVTLTLNMIRDYGAETIAVTALLTAVGSETIAIVSIDDATIAETKVIQFEIGDASAVSVAAWQLHRMAFKLRPEGRT